MQIQPIKFFKKESGVYEATGQFAKEATKLRIYKDFNNKWKLVAFINDSIQSQLWAIEDTKKDAESEAKFAFGVVR